MMVFDAIELATKWHHGQHRKDTINGYLLPYITHCIEGLKLLWTWGCGEEIILSAMVCHDLLEDTDCPPQEIAKIHPRALELVGELTCTPDQNKYEYMDSFARKSVEALVMKAADRICNVRDFQRTDPKYAEKYLGKASNLFLAVNDRAEEINHRFYNKETAAKIIAAKNNLVFRI